jgi:2-polyprenyl-3-methyl-5-hydroxy-6-metoxy-1,4-benzoquinol methylase
MSLSLVPPQRDRAELLDLNQSTLEEARRSLRDIRRINTYLGGTRLSSAAIFSMLRARDLRRATLLDIGTGLGDIPLQLQQEARRRNIELQTIGLDINARHLRIAREEYGSKVLWLHANAFRLPLPDRSVDIVHSSLFLHHFRPPQIIALLREFSRVARVGWVMNDLVRHGLPLWFFRTTWPIFARSYITRLDGTASIRRAYTAQEMQRIVGKIDGARVRSHFPFRLSITWQRRESDVSQTLGEKIL